METNRLFQTTSFEIDDKELTLRGCPDGTSFVFFVREREGERRGREERGRRGRGGEGGRGGGREEREGGEGEEVCKGYNHLLFLINAHTG